MSSIPTVSCADLGRFDTVIDVRSPAEYALDHVPGAVSAPVLDDDERARIGTLHKQVSAFAAKKAGAALVARNIARHLEAAFADRPREWSALIYCWRGGQRSGSMAEVFSRIGWRVAQLEGGYRAYRRHVLAELDALPRRLDFRIVCGVTGSGKSRLLQALARAGEQVLDLEELARHRGSVLGSLPDAPQPSQKMFDSLVWRALAGFAPGRAVFVEAESKKVGAVHVPDALMAVMRAAPCVRLEVDTGSRVALLKQEYAHFIGDRDALGTQLDCLVALHGRDRIAEWKALAAAGAWDRLVERLLDEHYDPAYLRGMARNYAGYDSAPRVRLDGIEAADYARAAAAVAALARPDAG
ncbi:MAG: tRNA 2-selenouridine(34) synthase MnmH [Burkholderiales bacterium]|nr:tRNA 2-selenouridine(34) synthase MnmH [Burkholderiales bacterium]